MQSDKLEPGTSMTSTEVSQAISLKRIADALEVLARPPTLIKGDSLPLDLEKLAKEFRPDTIIVGAPEPSVVRKVPVRLALTEIAGVKLKDAVPGLYMYNGELIVRTEYYTPRPCDIHTPDCYIVETGEFFTGGGGVSYAQLNDLMVTPVSVQLPAFTPPKL